MKLASAAKDVEAPDEEREAAFRELALSWFQRPIAPQRRRALSDAINAELANLAADGCTERDLVMAALTEAIPDVPEDVWAAASEGQTNLLRHAIASSLNRIATERLLGTDWRRRHQLELVGGVDTSIPDASSSDATLMSKEHARAAWRRYRALLRDSRPGDRCLLKALRRLTRHGTPVPTAKRQVAREYGVTVNAIDRALSRLRKAASG